MACIARLKNILQKLLGNTLYIQLSSNCLKATDVESGNEFNQPPFIAIERASSGKLTVKAVGLEAKNLVGHSGLEVINPYCHPRQLIGHFQYAEIIMQHAIRVVCRKTLFSPAPRVVLQPMEKLDGGLTDVEVRALRELCLGAGAREVVIYVGSPLLINVFNFAEIKRQGL